MIYLDNNATTKVAPEVLAEMLPYFSESYQNASSVSGEVLGIKGAVARSRRALGYLAGVSDSRCVVFTSGATESNNWIASIIADKFPEPRHLVTSSIEHPSVIEPMRRLERQGWRLTVVPVDGNGIVRLHALKEALCPATALVSIMAANNESGVLQPVAELAALVKAHAPEAYFHTDATQMIGKLPVSFDDDWAQVDFVSLSGHKFHGPKGIGAVILHDETDVPSLILGGGQEDGRRSGTSNVPGIVGIGAAAGMLRKGLKGDVETMAHMRDRFERDLQTLFPDAVIHGRRAPRLPNTSCFSLPGCEANHLAELLASDGICVGTGSACSSGGLHPPRTLLEMGVGHDMAAAALRLSLSRYSTAQELSVFLDRLASLREAAHIPVEGAARAG